MIDSPLAFCPVCLEIVLLDQTRAECARDHPCNELRCPLAASFTGIEFKEGAIGMPKRRGLATAAHGHGR